MIVIHCNCCYAVIMPYHSDHNYEQVSGKLQSCNSESEISGISDSYGIFLSMKKVLISMWQNGCKATIKLSTSTENPIFNLIQYI